MASDKPLPRRPSKQGKLLDGSRFFPVTELLGGKTCGAGDLPSSVTHHSSTASAVQLVGRGSCWVSRLRHNYRVPTFCDLKAPRYDLTLPDTSFLVAVCRADSAGWPPSPTNHQGQRVAPSSPESPGRQAQARGLPQLRVRWVGKGCVNGWHGDCLPFWSGWHYNFQWIACVAEPQRHKATCTLPGLATASLINQKATSSWPRHLLKIGQKFMTIIGIQTQGIKEHLPSQASFWSAL